MSRGGKSMLVQLEPFPTSGAVGHGKEDRHHDGVREV